MIQGFLSVIQYVKRKFLLSIQYVKRIIIPIKKAASQTVEKSTRRLLILNPLLQEKDPWLL